MLLASATSRHTEDRSAHLLKLLCCYLFVSVAQLEGSSAKSKESSIAAATVPKKKKKIQSENFD